MSKNPNKKSLSLTLRNYFITGVVVLIPIGFTLYLTKILIGISSNLLPKNINPNRSLDTIVVHQSFCKIANSYGSKYKNVTPFNNVSLCWWVNDQLVIGEIYMMMWA